MPRLRPAKCYRNLERPYTRKSRFKKKNYIRGGVPHLRVKLFVTGNKKGEFDTCLLLKSEINVQVRDVALEAARLAVTRYLNKRAGKGSFCLIIRKYPHHVLRWNPLATGAGADRFQKGMKLAYGKPIGIAAQVFEGDVVMELWVENKNANLAKRALKLAAMKMPGKYSIIISSQPSQQ